MTGIEIGMLVSALGQLGGGIVKDLANPRPQKEIPPALLQSLALAQMQAKDPLGPGYDQAYANQRLQSANQLAAAQASGNPVAIQSIIGAQNAGLRQLDAMSAQYKTSAEQNLQQKLENIAMAEDQQWQINEFARVADRKQEGRDMIGAGAQNLFNLFAILNSGGVYPGTKSTSAVPSGTFKFGAPW